MKGKERKGKEMRPIRGPWVLHRANVLLLPDDDVLVAHVSMPVVPLAERLVRETLNMTCNC